MSVLQDMINDSTSEIEFAEANIASLDEKIDAITVRINGIQNELTSVAESDLTDYLDNTKLAALSYLGAAYITYGPNYGLIDYDDGGITDFQIYDSTANLVYEYNGVNWDGDATIIKLVNDFAFGNDYLTRPLDSGAMYGMIPYRSALNTAKGILTQNKNKIQASVAVFEGYA